MQKKALFIIPAAFGHFNPIISLAKLLERNSYCVSIATQQTFKEVVEASGLWFITYEHCATISSSKIPLTFKGKLRLLVSNFSKLVTGELGSEFTLQVMEVSRMISSMKPDLLFVDAHLHGHLILLSNMKIKMISIETTMSSRKAEFIPPLNVFLIPSTSVYHKHAIAFLWLLNKMRKRLVNWRDFALYFGRDRSTLIRRWVKSHPTIRHKKFDLEKTFFDGIASVPEIVTSAREIDFPWLPYYSNQFHLNPISDTRSEEKLSTDFKLLIDNSLLEKQHKLILCSFGTLAHFHNPRVYWFYRKLIEVMRLNPNWTLILSAGKFSDDLPISSATSNVFIFTRLPQIQLLRHCDLFISHGTPNAISEAIAAETPLLIYPLNSRWDNNGGAARVIFHNIGLKGCITDSVAQISSSIRRTLNDSSFASNIRLMKEKLIANASREEEILEFILK